MMEGFDKQWRIVNNKMVTYTNLSPGDYTLFVKAWANDKNKALVRELHIHTLPPIWATSWAKALYILVILILGYLAFRYLNERASTRRNEQLMQAKLQFFTDISHEIRTPLTLILSPLSKLINKNNDLTLVQTYNTMYKNGIRLLQLVNQVMDLRAVEFGKKKLCTEEVNITIFVRDLKNSFNNLAEEKGLAYTFSSDPEEITGYIDTDIIAKVLFNLISNAFKYTEKGSISVSIHLHKRRKLILSITDTGKGVSPENKTLIFERFYTIQKGSSERANSSGIGLHLTSKLVKLHHGEIQLESNPGVGSCFSVLIPVLKEEYTTEEISENKTDTINSTLKPYLLTNNNKLQKTKKPSHHHQKYSLLIVEDNADIRSLIFSEFGEIYHILEASDGKEGLRIAMEKKPSIIISDVVMPEMDGIEFCKKIRHNEHTMDIPFILLTARTSIENQVEGLEYGADAYIAKPFDLNYLHAKIQRLIQSRENLRKNFIPETEADKQNYSIPESHDDKLLRKLNEVIHDNLDDTDLSVDVLCKKVGLSRTHLNRKMKDLTGESPATYIRQLRLRKSVRLLKEHNLTISEIAFTVGFSSPSYFSQAFRDYYGVTPKEYIAMEDVIHLNDKK